MPDNRSFDVDDDWYAGDRRDLRALFELADDSTIQLDDYFGLGWVLVARARSGTPIGHLQLVPTPRTGEIELKNMAVAEDWQGSGIGRALVEAAVARCRAVGWRLMIVGTGAADVGNLRFYQRTGFRVAAVERDAFTPATGYTEPILIDGILLRDRVWLSRELIETDQFGASTGTHSS